MVLPRKVSPPIVAIRQHTLRNKNNPSHRKIQFQFIGTRALTPMLIDNVWRSNGVQQYLQRISPPNNSVVVPVAHLQYECSAAISAEKYFVLSCVTRERRHCLSR
jgi:hypothetical protein